MLLSGCGGSELISGKDLRTQQGSADDVARLVVSTLVSDLGAAAPPGGSLGRGLYAGCDGGDPDEAAYFIDTFVTYDVIAPKDAARTVAKALASAGLKAEVDPKTYAVSTSKGAVTVDLTTQEKGGGSAGQNIFVSTGCLAIGKKPIAAFNAGNGRAVTP